MPEHSSDEFGKAPPPLRIHHDPVTQILLDGVVERESGRTPGPPVVPLWVVVVVVALIFLIGLALALFVVPHLSTAVGHYSGLAAFRAAV